MSVVQKRPKEGSVPVIPKGREYFLFSSFIRQGKWFCTALIRKVVIFLLVILRIIRAFFSYFGLDVCVLLVYYGSGF